MYSKIVVEHEQLFLTCSSLQECSDMLNVRIYLDQGEQKLASKILQSYLKSGNPEAEYLYSKAPSGNGSEQAIEAHHLNYIKKSAEKDYPPALYLLGAYYDMGDYVPADKIKAALLFKKAASLGHAHSQWIHGEDLLYGRNGIDKDEVLGVECIKKSANAKFEGALETVARFYEQGAFGFPKDTGKAEAARKQINNKDVIGY